MSPARQKRQSWTRSASNHAGDTLKDILSQRGLSQNYAATASGVSQPYVNQVMNGRRKASPEWIDLISAALRVSREERVRLHRAAAHDHGFKIDLTKE